jgi:WD40 repeat protein
VGGGALLLLAVPWLGAGYEHSPDDASGDRAAASAAFRSAARAQPRVVRPGTDVGAVAFCPDDRLLAVGGRNGVVTLWDSATGHRRAVLVGHTSGVFSLAFSADGRFLASGSGDARRSPRPEDCSIKIWDVAHGTELRTLVGHRGVVAGVAFSPFGGLLASAGHDRSVRIWDLTAGTLLYELPAHRGAVWSVAFSPDARLLATGEQRTIHLWSTAGYAEVGELRGHADFVSSLAFSPAGDLLASGSLDKTVRIWRVPDQAVDRVYPGHGAGVTALAFHPDGEQIASAGYDQTVRVWSVATGRDTTAPSTSGTWVAALAFSSAGTLASARGNAVELVDIAPVVPARAPR